jgi:hypothetical protein
MEIETRQLPSPSPPMQFKTVAFAIAPRLADQGERKGCVEAGD